MKRTRKVMMCFLVLLTAVSLLFVSSPLITNANIADSHANACPIEQMQQDASDINDQTQRPDCCDAEDAALAVETELPADCCNPEGGDCPCCLPISCSVVATPSLVSNVRLGESICDRVLPINDARQPSLSIDSLLRPPII